MIFRSSIFIIQFRLESLKYSFIVYSHHISRNLIYPKASFCWYMDTRQFSLEKVIFPLTETLQYWFKTRVGCDWVVDAHTQPYEGSMATEWVGLKKAIPLVDWHSCWSFSWPPIGYWHLRDDAAKCFKTFIHETFLIEIVSDKLYWYNYSSQLFESV